MTTLRDNPLHAPYYADAGRQIMTDVVENVRVARCTFRLRFPAAEIASRAVPGQFVMLRLSDWNDPLIGRPLAIYDIQPNRHGEPDYIDVVYLVKGKFTSHLADLGPGTALTVWGPLGNGFSPAPVEHLIMVAGGIGQTPFLTLGQEFLGHRSFGLPPRAVTPARRVTMLYGARSADLHAGVDDFRRAGIDLRLATDDGTAGHHGLVTDLLAQLLDEVAQRERVRVVCCGPEPMMAAVAAVTQQRNVPCELSLETPMACGIGICFTCVAKVKQPDGTWDYKRTCVEGPVFPAEKIIW